MGDSLDLVPIAAWHGMGRKAQWWSPVLLAVYDEDTGVYSAVCKCISENNDEADSSCYSARSQTCRHEYDTGGYQPDVWFEPREVWEIRGADITISPVYPAARGLVNEERGLSIRFPRFMQRRMDKGPEQASTPGQLAK
jgi:DNA ligase-1